MSRHRRKKILVLALIIPSSILLVLPILWLLILSFRPNSLIMKGIDSVTSTQLTFENYATLFTRYTILRYLLNSMIGSVVPALASGLVSILAAYALVRFRFRGHQFFQSLPLFAQIAPVIQVLIPLYALMLVLGILDTYIAVILAHISLVLPFTVWMLAGYLVGVPKELEEAAMIDGCSRLRAIFHIVIPVAMPGIVASVMVSFLAAWGEFLFPLVLTSSGNMRLLSVMVYLFIPGEQGVTSWGLLFAAAMVFMAPALLVFMLLQRSLRKGISVGAFGGQ